MVLFMALCLLVFLLCLCFPEISGSGIKNGLTLITGQVLPALYPFILLTTLFKYLVIHNNKYRFMPIFIGFLSGYPLGAKVAADYDDAAEKFLTPQSVLLICNNPSPAYMISFVGLHCLKDPSLGIRMYAAIIAGNLVTGLLFGTFGKRYARNKKTAHAQTAQHTSLYRKINTYSASVQPPSSASLLDRVIHDTFTIIINISSYILIFSVAAAFIQKIFFLPPIIQGIFAGMLEMTTGIQILTAQSMALNIKLLLMTGLVSFGGLSVMAQTNSMISGSSLSIKKYMTEKAIAVTIAVSVMYIII